jgi:hypothetical protein
MCYTFLNQYSLQFVKQLIEEYEVSGGRMRIDELGRPKRRDGVLHDINLSKVVLGLLIRDEGCSRVSAARSV